jgi:formylglycine-generating enzyme required for sulfatase activity
VRASEAGARAAKRALAAAIVVAAVAGAVVFALRRAGSDDGARCGPGFVKSGTHCGIPGGACPAPLVTTSLGCDAPVVKVLVPAAKMVVGPSDWEAEGRVRPRTIHTDAFRIDAFEVTVGQVGLREWESGEGQQSFEPPALGGAAALPLRGRTQAAADAICHSRGGRLPTEDEWMVAAASAVNPHRRYPWGDTGAVCRRAAWGLASGPCGQGATFPDVVGAHPDGDTPLGLHDMAGNVAEWVAGEPPAAKGGSYADPLASDLRIWARLELGGSGSADRVGFRCVYPP